MKVSKEHGKHEGWFVCVEVGRNTWSSYFSAPSKNIDHAGLKYLQERFPIITTEKRAIEFKKQYKKLWT